MSWLRSAAFNLCFFTWTAVLALAGLPLLLLPRRATVWFSRLWARGTVVLLRHIAGLRHHVRGWEHIPDGPVIYAFKHQSAWETVVLPLLIYDVAPVMKRELWRIPVYGWYLWRSRSIAVDRAAGASALRRMLRDARAAVAAGRSIMVAPEGTRTPPGQRRPYLPGVAALYAALAVPVVPVALNTGLYWPRRSFRKRPGTAVFAFLPPIPPGLDKRTFLTTLQEQLEEAAQALLDTPSPTIPRSASANPGEKRGKSVEGPDF